MNSPAIRQNVDSWSGLFASHLEIVKNRSAAALESAGFDGLLVHAGTPPLLFLDDHHLPFRVQAPFKVWAPLSDAPDSFVFFAPGKKPLLLVHQPVDYWHKSPEMPNDYWTPAFDIVSCADRAAGRAAKTPYEVACLLEANVLGARGHVAAEQAFRAGATEFEIALAFMKDCGH